MVRQGAIDSPPKCPFILGFECAGEIEQVGEGVEGFAVSQYFKWNDSLIKTSLTGGRTIESQVTN